MTIEALGIKLSSVWPILTASFVLFTFLGAKYTQDKSIEDAVNENKHAIMSIKQELSNIEKSQIRSEEALYFIKEKIKEK